MPVRRRTGRWRRSKNARPVNIFGEPVGDPAAWEDDSSRDQWDDGLIDGSDDAGVDGAELDGEVRSWRSSSQFRSGEEEDDATSPEAESDAESENGALNGDKPGRVPLEFNQTATARQITPLVLRNILFNILTLSLYRFWARTHVRRYLWSTTTINGEALEYSGRGIELFLGFLFATVFVFLPLIAGAFLIEFLRTVQNPAYGLLFIPWALLFALLFGVAIYRARAYRLSRTSWRSIRFSQTGSSLQYGFRYVYFSIGNVLALSWLTPLQNVTLMRQMMSNMWFGDRQFRFSGQAGPLYRVFAIVWVLNLFLVVGYVFAVSYLFPEFADNVSIDPSNQEEAFASYQLILAAYGLLLFIALTTVWYQAKEMRYFAESTCLESVRFKLRATTLSLLWLWLGNLIIIVITFGLGLPYTQVRNFRYMFRRLEGEGELDIHGILQTSRDKPGLGEGLADAFDLGAV